MASRGRRDDEQWDSSQVVPYNLRVYALKLSMKYREDGLDHKKWRLISRKVSRKMKLTIPIHPDILKGQVNAYVVKCKNKTPKKRPLMNEDTIFEIIDDLGSNNSTETPRKDKQRLRRGLAGFKVDKLERDYEHEDEVSDELDEDLSMDEGDLMDECDFLNDNPIWQHDKPSARSDSIEKRTNSTSTSCFGSNYDEAIDLDFDDDMLANLDNLNELVNNPRVQKMIAAQTKGLRSYEKLPNSKSVVRDGEKVSIQEKRKQIPKSKNGKENIPPGFNGEPPLIVENMEPEEVFATLKKEYNQDFPFILEQKINGSAFYNVRADHMKEWGVVFGDVCKIEKLQNLQQQGTHLRFGPAMKTCVSQNKRLLQDILDKKIDDNMAKRQQKLDAANLSTERKSDLRYIVTRRKGSRGAISYVCMRADGRAVPHARQWMLDHYPEMTEEFDQENPHLLAHDNMLPKDTPTVTTTTPTIPSSRSSTGTPSPHVSVSHRPAHDTSPAAATEPFPPQPTRNFVFHNITF